MRSRSWMAYGALALAVAFLAPTLAPLSGSMDAFAADLANGTFRPFGPTQARSFGYSSSLGGFTGHSTGDYVPGASEVPPTWKMDRDGRGGSVVVDYVFNPALGAMKRLKAYDRISDDGTTLLVADTQLRPQERDASLPYDRPMQGSFRVQFRPGEPIPIYSPHPKAIVTSYKADPPMPGGIAFFKDGADTFYAVGNADKLVTLNLTYLTSSEYYGFRPPESASVHDYPSSVRPQLSPKLEEDAQVVLSRAGVQKGDSLAQTLEKLNGYFRSFTEGDIPPPERVEDLYLALALGGHGCCRHRAFAYMITAQAADIPTRVVVNEAHAFVEVLFPNGRWHQVNLGGCGFYTVNNPNDFPDLFDQAGDPRREANPDEARELPHRVTITNITESPARIVKGQSYFVNGTVEEADGTPVAGARIDVYLNETKTSPGRLTGAGTTDSRGHYSVLARVPPDLPAQSYQLVARSAETVAERVRYEESWSDPPVDVFTPTKFVLGTLRGAVGYPVNVTGLLVDVEGKPVVDKPVTWYAEGELMPTVRTDRNGRFASSAVFDRTGTMDLEFRYPGDQHHGSAIQAATLTVEPGAILLPPEPATLLRGEKNALDGVVAMAGSDLSGQPVRVSLLDERGQVVVAVADARVERSGRFSIPLALPDNLPPGPHALRFEAPTLGLAATAPARVLVRATLEVEAPSSISPAEPWALAVRVVSDDGAPVAGALLEFVVDGNATTTRALTTNTTGVARLEMPPRALAPGAHQVRISFEGDDRHAAVETLAAVTVALPWYASVPLWALGAAAFLVAVALALGWLLRPAGPARAAWRRFAATQRPARVHILLSFPQHPDGVPPVFEPGERALVRVHARHRDGREAGARVLLRWPDGRARLRARAGQDVAELDVPPQEGSLVLEARARGLARLWSRATRVSVPIHDYRRAVEEGYVALREAARLDPAASPEDLLRALEGRIGAQARARLQAAARLFEVADYSQERVDRTFYHSFAAARLAVERDLEAPHAAA